MGRLLLIILVFIFFGLLDDKLTFIEPVFCDVMTPVQFTGCRVRR